MLLRKLDPEMINKKRKRTKHLAVFAVSTNHRENKESCGA